MMICSAPRRRAAITPHKPTAPAPTTPLASWPMRRPVSLYSIVLYGQRSLPQMAARVTTTRASVGSIRRASGTVSIWTSPAPNITVARIVSSPPASSGLRVVENPVLFVANLFHPVGGLPVELVLNGDVRHGRRCRGAVPMLLTRREPDHVPRPNLLDRPSPALCQAAASCHNQRLAQRLSVPCRPSAGLERDTGADRACRIVCLKQGVDAYYPGEVLGRSFAGRL